MHEELFPNEPVETYMDLHNNQVGMDLFRELLQGIHRQFFETSFFVDKLFEKTKTAVVIEKPNEGTAGTLVYLKNPPERN